MEQPRMMELLTPSFNAMSPPKKHKDTFNDHLHCCNKDKIFVAKIGVLPTISDYVIKEKNLPTHFFSYRM